MKILVTGADGQVGHELVIQGKEAGHEVIAANRQLLDITDQAAVSAFCLQHQPQAIINAAAYTAVDKAESETERAFAVNAEAVKYLAKAALELSIPILHISTDYVFDGIKKSAYVETDMTCPINVYGQSKLLGEQYLEKSGANYLVLRTSWVFGLHGNNFVKTMINLATERDELSVIDDQYGSPTYARDIAIALLTALPQLEDSEKAGIYHYAGNSAVSWCQFAREIIMESVAQQKVAKMPKIHAIFSSAYPTAAARPKNSVLAVERFQSTFGLAPSDWRRGVKVLIAQISNLK